MADRTFVILKPDAVERRLAGEILSRFERRGLTIAALEHRTLDLPTLRQHYAEHIEKPFFPELAAFMSRSPVITLILEGPKDTWKVVRDMMGKTNPVDSAPGTIRGDFGLVVTENLVHGSDSAESAEREIGIFFPGR